MYIYRYMYICIYIYIYIYVYIYIPENNAHSQLSPQLVSGNTCTWSHDVLLCCPSCAQVNELPQIHCGNNREDTLFL